MEDVYLKVLMGDSTLEDYEDGTNMSDDVIEDSVFRSIYLELSKSIGDENFQVTFKTLFLEILNYSFEKKRKLCFELKNKIEDIYKFSFDEDLVIYVDEDCILFLKFIEFVEYNCIEFLSNFWKKIFSNGEDMISINVFDFYINNLEVFDKNLNKTVEEFKIDNKYILWFLNANQFLSRWLLLKSDNYKEEIIEKMEF